MKRTVQINIGGMPFIIDDDAYRRLDSYLVDLEHYFAKSGSQEEIMSDIEARIAELLESQLKSRRIVQMADVEVMIRVMGTPRDFDADSESSTKDGPWDIKTGKRFFRDPDDKVIGGVCSGLAAYFGIQEVIWIRLAFVLVFLTMGFGVLVYIILWALVPEAKTAADRLAMMGEQANARNIGHMVERGIEDISSTIKQNWKEWHDGKRKRRHQTTVEDDNGSSSKGSVYLFTVLFVPLFFLVRVVRVFVWLIRKIFKGRRIRYQRHRFV
jgi:phage shock protein PspC (stress-responsive transcriptional regulator)